MPDSSDIDLVKRAQGGDVNAIGDLYDRYHQRIFKYVWVRTRNTHLAEDLTGEIFTRMVKNLPHYQPRGVAFAAWLYRIAHNLVVDHYRKEDRRDLLPLFVAEEVQEDDRNPSAIVEEHLDVERLQVALDQIDESQREVIELRFLMGMSLKEVAQNLDRTVAAVKSLQHRGLKAMRAIMKRKEIAGTR